MMKFYNFCGICLSLWLLCVFNACSNEGSITDEIKRESCYDRMGQLHNECLDTVFQKIISVSVITKGERRSIPDMVQIRKMCREFAREKDCKLVTRGGEGMDKDPLDWSDFPEERRLYLNKLKKILQKSCPEQVENLKKQIYDLEKSLKEDVRVNFTEREILLNVMAVCRYSAVYWAENFEKRQYELYGITRAKVRTRGECKDEEWWNKYGSIVLADGAGGIYNGQYILENAAAESLKSFMK